MLLAASTVWGVTIPATPDLSCAQARIKQTLNCTANDFTVGATFSAAPGTPPFCALGQPFEFQVDMDMTSNSPDRYDIGFFFGQNGNNPATDSSNNCSVATFPTSAIPSSPPTIGQPWGNIDGKNACSDFLGTGVTSTRINKIKVLCQGNTNGSLVVPYILVYSQNAGTANSCTGPGNVIADTPSKCQGGASTPVAGVVPVNVGAYLDVTKQTTPDGDSQAFSYTATGPAGSKVVAQVGMVFTPADLASATNTVTVSLTDGQTARFFLTATASDQTLTVTEAAATNWESTAAISCAPVTGSPALSFDNATRTMSATLNATNSAAACSITNTKKATVTLQKNIGGRVNANDQFALIVTDVTATTTGSTTGLQGVSASKTVSGGTAVTLSEAISGTGTLLTQYSQTIGCSNTLTGSSTVLPSGSVASFPISLTPVAGDNITCTITNNAKPTITKAFGVANLASGSNTSMTVTIGNPNASAVTLTSALTDTFPSGMTINTAGNTGTCSGVTATAGAGSFTMANGTSIPSGGCTVIVNITSATTGTATNTIAVGALQTSVGNNVAPASASINVYAPPTVTKTFGVATIGTGGTTTLTLTLGNPAGNIAPITGVRVDDTFPAGLTLQDTTFTFTPAACGTVTRISGAASAAGDNNIRFSSASVASGATCQVAVNVTSSTPGSITNTTNAPTATGPVALTGTTASAPLNVVQASLNKAFNPATISQGGTSTLTFTLTNGAGSPAQSGINFTDTLPANVTVAAIPNITTSCPSGIGVVTGTGGSGNIVVTGATMSNAMASCTISVDVTSNTPGGPYNNTSANIGSTARLTNSVTSSGLTVQPKPTLTKTYGTNPIRTGNTSILTFTINNIAGNPAQSNLGFTDTFPAGLTVTAVGAITGTGCTGTTAYTASTISLSNGAITAGNNSCTFTATVRGDSAGTYLNDSTRFSGQTGGLSTGTASATLNVYVPPTITKSFAPGSISYGGTATMTITVTNPAANPGNLTGVAVSDSYTGTLMNNAAGSVACSGLGSATLTGGTNGGTSVGFNSGTIVPGGTCTITQSVTATSTNNNTTGAPTATGPMALTGTTASATLTVAAVAPTVTKAFAVGNLASGGNTSLTVIIGNANGGAIALTSALTDSFPAGMTIGTAGNTGTCPGATATAGAGSFTMASGTSIPAGGCTVIVNVTSSTAGTATNTIAAGALQTVAGNNAAAASATLNVYAPPTAAKSIVSPFNSGATTTMTLTVVNPSTNPGTITVQLDDTFPAGLTLQNAAFTFTPAACGTVTKISGAASTASDNNVRLTAAGLTANSSCQAQLNVTSSTPGTTTNTTSAPLGTAPVATTGVAASATLTVTNVFPISGTVYNDGNHNGIMDSAEAGTGQTLFVKLAVRSGATCANPATASAAADPSTGAFTLPTVIPGDYCLILDDNAILSDTAPTYPPGRMGMETPSGIRAITVAATPLTAQNFGLYYGSRLSGRVFDDTGVGSGTPNNGVQDGGETGLSNVTVKVTDNGGGTVYDSAVTTGSGDYTLWIPGSAGSSTLRVTETNLAGSISTGGDAGTTGGAYDRTADTVTFANTPGSTYSGATFADVPANTFVASNSRSVVPGGAIFYPHTFTAGTGGTVAFSSSAVANPVISGWSEVLYLDSNCNGAVDAGEPQVNGPIAATAGQQVCILVKEFAPANAPVNATNSVTVTATFNYVSASPALVANLTLTDLTTAMQSGLTLLKYVDKASAMPGDTLTYTITYLNSGFSQLANIVISDNVPVFTNSPSACCVNPSTACLGAPPTSFPASITGCTIVTTSSSVSWTLSGNLAPGASGQVKFSVKVDQ